MNNNKNIENECAKYCFYYPHSQVISGGLFYFYKLAEFLSLNKKNSVYVVNYKDSKYTEIYKEQYTSTNIKFLNYEETYGSLDDDTIFFTYLNMLPLMLESFKHLKKARIFLIDFHPHSHLFLINNLGIKKEKTIKDLFNIFYETNSLSFMDKSCLEVVNEISCKEFLPQYIPAFLENTNVEFANSQIVDTAKINVGCVCRLDRDKIYTVINFLDNLYQCNLSKPIRVHVVGDGNSKHCINLEKYKDKLDIIMTSYLYGNDLKLYFSQNVDIAFNFGVAALDMAAQKLPVVIPMYQETPHNIDKYYFLFDTKDYILGCKEELVEKYGIRTYTTKEILELIYAGNNKEILGNKCYEYLINNHMANLSVEKFVEYAKDSNLTFETCLNFLPFSKLVNEFAKARKNGFDWDLFIANKKSSNVSKIRLSLAFYGLLLILATVPIIKDYIKLSSIQTRINKKINILRKRNKKQKTRDYE